MSLSRYGRRVLEDVARFGVPRADQAVKDAQHRVELTRSHYELTVADLCKRGMVDMNAADVTFAGRRELTR